MKKAEAFDEAWPELSRRLSATLRARSIAPALADDVVQETGLRLFRTWDRVDSDRSIWGLTLTIANQVLWGQAQERSCYELVDKIPDRPGASDTERETIARLELKRVRRAMSRLSPSYRNVLLAEIDGSRAVARTDGAVKVMRLRARRKLGALLEQGYGIVFGSPLHNLATRLQGFRRSRSRPGEMAAPAMAVAIAAALATFAPGPAQVLEPAARSPRFDVSSGTDAEGPLAQSLLAQSLLGERLFALEPRLSLSREKSRLESSVEKATPPAPDVIVDAGPVYVAREYPTNKDNDPVKDIVEPATCSLDLDLTGGCEDRP